MEIVIAIAGLIIAVLIWLFPPEPVRHFFGISTSRKGAASEDDEKPNRHLVDTTTHEHGTGPKKAIPAKPDDKFIFDVILKENGLTCDTELLRETLSDFVRSEYTGIRVRIPNHNFNTKVIDIAKKAGALLDMPSPVAKQIKRRSRAFPLHLPIYWVNLSDLLGRIIEKITVENRFHSDAVDMATDSVLRTLELAQYGMYEYLSGAVFPIHAEQYGYSDIASYLRRFETLEATYRHDREGLVRHICEIPEQYILVWIDIDGEPARRILDSKILLPLIKGSDDYAMVQATCTPQTVILPGSWYWWCLPQIGDRFLQLTTFREAKPLHELSYNMGISLDDYRRIGLA